MTANNLYYYTPNIMPELPEVEALRLGLVPRLVGSTINKVQVLNTKIVSSSGTTRIPNIDKLNEFQTALIGLNIVDITRRAKNLMIRLDNQAVIVVHLKMTGQLVFEGNNNSSKVVGGHPIANSQADLPHKHTYIIFELDNGKLYYNDVRQFGYVLYYPSYDEFLSTDHFNNLGVEPLSDDFQLKDFQKRLKNKNSPIKTILLNQSVVVGCGNIYADESCFASGILPTRLASSLTQKEVSKLYSEIKRILQLAVDSGGSSIANYLLADGSRGNYADNHLVYGKKNQKCSICGNLLSDIKLAGRTTIFCTHCQC